MQNESIKQLAVEAKASRLEHPHHVEQASGSAAENGQERREHRYDHLNDNLPNTILHTLHYF